MIGGYWNRLLRVDLTSGRCAVTPLPSEAILRQYVGGIGLGMKLLLDEIRPGQQATDPTSPLIMLAGPLAGTSAPSSSNLAITTLNYNVPYTAAAECCIGYWAAYLKHAGYDGVVVTGRARKPVFLWIDDQNVAIRDATALWGLDTRETERLIRRSLYDQSRISVACIGPAGEAMLPGASIRNDCNHGVHNGGVGAVMGSKRLKAIAVRGSKQVPLKNRVKFEEITRVWSEAIHVNGCSFGADKGHARVMHGYASDGESWMSTHNLGEPTRAGAFLKRFADAAANSWTVVPKGSYNCRIPCAYDCHINEGEFAGATASVCDGAESLAGAVAMVGIEDPSAAIVLTDYFDAIGLDSSVAGALVGMAFELFNRGILTLKDTDGLDLTWGNFDSARELLDQMIEGRGFGGRVLVKGLKEVARNSAPETGTRMVTIHGDGLNMDDWRCVWRKLLGEIMPGVGVRRRERGVDALTVEMDLGYTKSMPPFDTKDTVETVARTQEKRLWDGCLGVCWYTCCGVKGGSDYSIQALGYATGWEDFSAEEAVLVGERVADLQRRVATRLGSRSE